MSDRKVVFLDIDGVLNDSGFIADVMAEAERTGVAPQDAVAALVSIIDPERVEYLNEIVERSGAILVGATSWREVLTLDELNDALVRRGCRVRLADVTPLEPKGRGHQIAAWLARNADVETFVILDDEHAMDPVESAVIRTDNTVGLTPELVQRALERLV